MPDRRTHRGPHPEDARLFGVSAQPSLRAAAADLCRLLSRGYARDSALKLVGDRYALMARQRTAVSRCCCSDAEADRRRRHEVGRDQLPGAVVWLDGYNVLTTIEAALAGGVILAARDGAYRDMASMHGSYRKVAETLPALDLLGHTLAADQVSQCCWLLDRPVSNSGRLKAIIEEMAAARHWPWQVELVADPDVVLSAPSAVGDYPNSRVSETGTVPLDARSSSTELRTRPIVVATADSAILDRCPAWFNLARETICRHVPSVVVVDLDGTDAYY